MLAVGEAAGGDNGTIVSHDEGDVRLRAVTSCGWRSEAGPHAHVDRAFLGAARTPDEGKQRDCEDCYTQRRRAAGAFHGVELLSTPIKPPPF